MMTRQIGRKPPQNPSFFLKEEENPRSLDRGQFTSFSGFYFYYFSKRALCNRINCDIDFVAINHSAISVLHINAL